MMKERRQKTIGALRSALEVLVDPAEIWATVSAMVTSRGLRISVSSAVHH